MNLKEFKPALMELISYKMHDSLINDSVIILSFSKKSYISGVPRPKIFFFYRGYSDSIEFMYEPDPELNEIW